MQAFYLGRWFQRGVTSSSNYTFTESFFPQEVLILFIGLYPASMQAIPFITLKLSALLGQDYINSDNM